MPDRPQMSLRIGVTGARRLPATSVPFLRKQVRTVLEVLAAELLHLERDYGGAGQVKSVFRGVPRLQVTSPLARGADRLVAQTAMEIKAKGLLVELSVPMPFPVSEYEQDFTGTGDNLAGELPLTAHEDLSEFRALLSHAVGVIELDGTHANLAGIHDSASLAYEAVGRYVVRHSDVILAIWDGKPSNGRGGTAEIVLRAVSTGVPLLWIHATRDTAPIWIDNGNTLDTVLEGTTVESDPWEMLRAYVRQQIAPPLPPQRHTHGMLDKLALIHKSKQLHPLSTYFDEKVGRRWPIWRIHGWLMKHAGRLRPAWSPPAEPVDVIGRYWFTLYTQADSLASEYAARYRSSYVWTILLSACTLIVGTLSGSMHHIRRLDHRGITESLSILELLCLVLILLNVMAAIRNEWHEKSIEYRLLAELFRKQQTLAIVDWTLPLKSVHQCTDTERLRWVQWLFAAAERSAPLSKSPRLPNPERSYRIDCLLEEQISYHETRRAVSHNALQLFEFIGTVTFLLVILCVIVKVMLEFPPYHPDTMTVFELLTVIFPTISAAFITLRGYAELQLLVEQSRQMAAELKLRKESLQRINLDRYLASIELGEQALGITTLMLQDLEGWGRLFRGKIMEAG
jgi:hypothetical protein